MTTIYIAGPMSGIMDFNFPAFDEAEEAIRADHPDVTVINPAKNFGGRTDLPYESYLNLAEQQVAKATTVVLLPGWEASPGVHRELEVAEANDIRVVDYTAYMGVPFGPLGEPDPLAVTPDEDGLIPCRYCGQRIVNQETEKQVHRAAHTQELINETEQIEGSTIFEEPRLPQPVQPDPEPLPEKKERITDEAYRIVMGDRQSDYNHPYNDFKATGRMWAALLTNWLNAENMTVANEDFHDITGSMPDIPPRIVALMMASLKASRESHKPKHDNRTDGIGYWLCADRIVEEY